MDGKYTSLHHSFFFRLLSSFAAKKESVRESGESGEGEKREEGDEHRESARKGETQAHSA